jgi:hypothetical protein
VGGPHGLALRGDRPREVSSEPVVSSAAVVRTERPAGAKHITGATRLVIARMDASFLE